MNEEYQLYGAFGDRYDLHTPAHHYKHDHEFIIKRARAISGQARILDLGCGTGVFLEKALAAGLDPIGMDPAGSMLALAEKRVGPQRVHLAAMQDLKARNEYDCIVSLSWSINYCSDRDELRQVLGACKNALKPGGALLLQVAHAPHAVTEAPDFFVDQEPGPGGPEDIVLRYRFWASDPQTMMAEYHFHCVSTHETFQEVHPLRVADAHLIAATAHEVGFEALELLEDYSGRPLQQTFSPFVCARRP